MKGRRLAALATALILSGIVMLGASAVLAAAPRSPATAGWTGAGMMGGAGMMVGAGMMGGASSLPGPGENGFVGGTPALPRVVRILASPHLRFLPDVVTVQAGETITFEVTTMGPTVHEFMVGPAEDVAVNKAGTPEIADIGMMQTKSVTYTFTGSGPFAFACHAPGHYEAGMNGTIAVR